MTEQATQNLEWLKRICQSRGLVVTQDIYTGNWMVTDGVKAFGVPEDDLADLDCPEVARDIELLTTGRPIHVRHL